MAWTGLTERSTPFAADVAQQLTLIFQEIASILKLRLALQYTRGGVDGISHHASKELHMTLTQAVVSYGIVFLVLLIGLGLSLWWRRISWPKLPRLALANWRAKFNSEKQNLANGEFWLKVLLATFIALCGGVSLATFVFSYGSGWVVIGLLASLLLLAVLLPYLLA